jgi:hypothetical protein
MSVSVLLIRTKVVSGVRALIGSFDRKGANRARPRPQARAPAIPTTVGMTTRLAYERALAGAHMGGPGIPAISNAGLRSVFLIGWEQGARAERVGVPGV